MSGFTDLFDFEDALADYTGAPYVVLTDGCTHAIELCMRYYRIKACAMPAHTYISVLNTMRQLGVYVELTDDRWIGEYQLLGTQIWDSARRLEEDMYRPGHVQCLSFGHSKPLELGKVGAILLDDAVAYASLSRWRSDGRDLRVQPWQAQVEFDSGFHYCPTLEDCRIGLKKLKSYQSSTPVYREYPDLRKLTIDVFPFA